MGALFEARDEGFLMTPLDARYTQIGFNLISGWKLWSSYYHHVGFFVHFVPNLGQNFGLTQPNVALTQGNLGLT